MPNTSNNDITDADRLTLAATMDHIIPPVDGLLGAGEMGLAEQVEQIARRIPRYKESLIRILDALSLEPIARAEGGFAALNSDQQIATIRTVESSMEAHFANFVQMVYTAYYSDSNVHKRIGWRTGALQPLGWDLEPFDTALLEKVSKREPFWRKA